MFKMEQDGNFLTEKNIGEAHRLAILDVLTRQFLGQGSLVSIIDDVDGISRTTFYRLREMYPEDFDEIKAEARKVALTERSDKRVSHDAYKENLSYELEEYVGGKIRDVVDSLLLIVNGEPYEVSVLVNRRDESGQWERVYEQKSIVPYPRDMVSAANALHAFLRDGVLPESSRMPVSSAAEVEELSGGLMPIFAGSTAFKRIEGTAPDGTRVVVDVEHPGIIEVEDIPPDEDGDL